MPAAEPTAAAAADLSAAVDALSLHSPHSAAAHEEAVKESPQPVIKSPSGAAAAAVSSSPAAAVAAVASSSTEVAAVAPVAASSPAVTSPTSAPAPAPAAADVVNRDVTTGELLNGGFKRGGAENDPVTGVYDEIEIEDMEYDEEREEYSYPCPCGDKFRITKNDLLDGEDIARCASCSLLIKVIFDPDDLEEEDE